MRKLLEADMRRIMSKIVPWLLLVASWVYLAVSLAKGIGDSPDRNFFYVKHISQNIGFVDLVIGFSALLGVYGDEFKSMAMIGVIGRGISRDKFVISKFLDALFLILEMIILSVIFIAILKVSFGITLNATENKFMVCFFTFMLIEEIAYVTIAAIFYFLSENAAIGLFAYLAFELIVPLALRLTTLFSPMFKRMRIETWYIQGMIASGFSDFIMGDIAGAFLMILPAIVIYILAMLVISILIFRKKELEF